MKTKSHSISGAFVFMLLGVFAVFSMLLVVLGAQAYRATVDNSAAHTQKRIVTAFVRNAVRAQDERGAIAVEDHDGLPVLALSSELDGEPVCDAQRFEPTLEGNLLTVRVTDANGEPSTVYIARRCAQ